MKKEYTIEDFRPIYHNTPIIEHGYAYADGRVEINTSSILTRLIQTAGRFCERFASDLFIDWQVVQDRLWEIEPGETETWLLGFREDGVDHAEFILCNLNSSGWSYCRAYYRKMYRITLAREADGYDLYMTLDEVETI